MKIKRVLSLAAFSIVVGATIFAMVSRTNPVQPTDTVSVVASFYPLYDFAKQVGGNYVNVTNITPAGAEPHDYEPIPQDLVRAQKAAVFIYNGGTLEPWSTKFLADYHHVAVKASTGIQLHMINEDGKEIRDPHFWLDPVLAQQIVLNIRDGLIKADPSHQQQYTVNAARSIATLKNLDADFKQQLAHCQQDTIITSHEAFGYIAKRYNFTALAIAGISPDQEPSANKMAELAAFARQRGVKYIFFESLVSPRLAATIAQEAGAQTTVFDPLEGLTEADQKQGKNYVSVQRENLAALRTALACQ